MLIKLLHKELKECDWSNSVIVMGDNMLDIPIPVIDLSERNTSVQFHWTNTILLRQQGVTPKAVVYLWPPHMRLIEYTESAEYINRGIYDISYYNDKIVFDKFDKTIREDINFSKEWVKRPINSLVHSKVLVRACQLMWSCPVLNYYDVSWGHEPVNIVQDIQNKLC